jgi:hypothetical protein
VGGGAISRRGKGDAAALLVSRCVGNAFHGFLTDTKKLAKYRALKIPKDFDFFQKGVLP